MTAKENLEKAAYTVVGAPVAGVKAAKAGAEKLAESVKESRRNLKADAIREFDQWVAEGEIVVDRMLDWLRSAGASTEVRSARRNAAVHVRSGVSKISKKIDKALDVVELDIALEEIRGIGPANAEKLVSAGVSGIAGFLARTENDDAIGLLADETGISVDTLAEWRLRADLTRIDGIGDAYQRMLHAVGIGTLTRLANAEAKALVEALEAIDQAGMPRQNPGESEVSDWIETARRLSLAGNA